VATQTDAERLKTIGFRYSAFLSYTRGSKHPGDRHTMVGNVQRIQKALRQELSWAGLGDLGVHLDTADVRVGHDFECRVSENLRDSVCLIAITIPAWVHPDHAFPGREVQGMLELEKTRDMPDALLAQVRFREFPGGRPDLFASRKGVDLSFSGVVRKWWKDDRFPPAMMELRDFVLRAARGMVDRADALQESGNAPEEVLRPSGFAIPAHNALDTDEARQKARQAPLYASARSRRPPTHPDGED